jgi:hypothetical protein
MIGFFITSIFKEKWGIVIVAISSTLFSREINDEQG